MATLAERSIDTQLRIVTPENISFGYRIAGPFQRLPAYLLDLLFEAIVLVVGWLLLLLVFGSLNLGQIGAGLGLVLFFVISWFYGGLFETLWNGQTPGKRLMRLRVLSADGQPINAMQAILRNVLRGVDCLPAFNLPGTQIPIMLWQFGFLSTAANDRFARLGDLACGTVVVVEEPRYSYGVMRVSEPEALDLAMRLPLRIDVSRGLALALSAYVSRRRVLPWARRVQIARHVAEPLRQRYGLPANTSYDLLLCALYHRVFFADLVEEEPRPRLEPVATASAP